MKNSKKFVALSLAAALTLTGAYAPVPVSAATTDYTSVINSLNLKDAKKADLDKITASTDLSISEKNLKEEKKLYNDDDMVRVVISVDANSLVDNIKSSKLSAEKYLDSASASNSQQAIKKTINTVSSAVINNVKKDGVSTKVLYTYDTVFTGFSVKVPYKEVATIRATKGVKKAFIAASYSIPTEPNKAVENTPNMISSREMIGTSDASSIGYEGDGMVVGVLDTGIDYNHNAFDPSKLSGVDVAETEDSITYAVDSRLALDSEALYKAAGKGTLKGSDVYKTLKVPYGFDYTDYDSDPIPVHDENHGTHVSGTIAGNSTEVKGVAPNAQIMIFKVFNDNGGGCYDDVLIAALDDAVKLHVDSINMSLGSSGGLTTDANAAMQEVYDAVGAAGINLNVSAGNSNVSTDENNLGAGYASRPDDGIVGSPSTYASAFSVASIENTHINFCNVITVNGNNYGYTDNAPTSKAFSTLGAGSFDYVVCGLGTTDDFTGKDLTNKVALVQRGSITFSEKVKNAAAAGAKAVIVYNNAAGVISMSIDNYLIPAVSITKADGQAMANAASKTFTFDPDTQASIANPTGGTMSDFTSWGPTPELSLKPEITTPGGNIYSAYYVENGESVNGLMSGTSMACPHLAGATTLVRQALQAKYPSLSDKELQERVISLLMSTASPVEEDTDLFYSPRRQGAGLLNIADAIQSPAYLDVIGSERPKAELGYNTTGTYTFDFRIKNTSSDDLEYSLDAVVQSGDYAVYGTYKYITQTAVDITSACDVKMSIGGTPVAGNVTVPAKGSKTIKVTIKVDKNNALIKDLAAGYTNGFYVEGFVLADAVSGTAKDLSLPYLGFCGDWASLDMFDYSLADYLNGVGLPYFNYGNCAKTNTPLGSAMLGLNLVSSNEDTTYSSELAAISKNSVLGVSNYVPETYLLRGASKVVYTYKDASGKVIKSATYNGIPKSYYHSGYGALNCEQFLDTKDYYIDLESDSDSKLADGKYTLEIKATPAVANAKAQTYTDSFYIDNELPKAEAITFAKDGKQYLYVTFSDNHYLSLVAFGGTEVIFDEPTKTYSELLDITGLTADQIAAIEVEAADLALNDTTVSPVDVTADTTKITSAKNTAGKITLKWNKSTDAEGYNVYKSTSKNGAFTKVATVTGKETYEDKSVTLGKTYYYQVAPYRVVDNKTVEGTKSAVVSCKAVTPGTATISKIKKANKTSVKITLKKQTGVSGYVIYRSTKKNGKFKKVKTLKKATSTTYTDKIGAKKTYYYKVRAYYTSGKTTTYGAYSKVVKGSTK